MRWLHLLLALVGALLLGAWLAPPLGEDPGYVLIRFQGWAFETTAVALALLVIVVYFLARVALWLLRLPGRTVRGAVAGRRESRLERGLLAYAEGRWSRAEKLLAGGARGGADPAAHYLAAARAAHAGSDEAARERYLVLAEDQGETARFATEVTRAELMLADGDAGAAAALLEPLHRERPRNAQVLRLLAACHRAREDWSTLRALTPAMRRTGALGPEQADAQERECAAAELVAATGPEQLAQTWSSLPRARRREPGLVLAYAERARTLGVGADAADLVQKTLRRQWHDDLVLLYGQLPHADAGAALRRAEGWLSDHPDNAALMLTLGRLCRRAELWGKAREYLERSLTFQARADTYRELAELKEREGDTAGAMACYRNVVHLGRDEPVEPVRSHRRLGSPVAEEAEKSRKAPE